MVAMFLSLAALVPLASSSWPPRPPLPGGLSPVGSHYLPGGGLRLTGPEVAVACVAGTPLEARVARAVTICHPPQHGHGGYGGYEGHGDYGGYGDHGGHGGSTGHGGYGGHGE